MASKSLSSSAPAVTNDPRFRAGRSLVQTGKAAEGAIGMFATLVEESRRKHGDASVETAACYYEYGNALFRSACRAEAGEGAAEGGGGGGVGGDIDGNAASSNEAVAVSSSGKGAMAAAAAAEERAKAAAAATAAAAVEDDRKRPAKGAGEEEDPPIENAAEAKGERSEDNVDEEKKGGDSTKPSAAEAGGGEDGEDASADEGGGDDVTLALELMENSWAILDEYVNDESSGASSPAATTGAGAGAAMKVGTGRDHLAWAEDQLPRILVGIGDVLSHRGRHADAADAYTRAIPHREASAAKCKPSSDDAKEVVPTVEYLRRRRLLTETHVLVSEELLAAPPGEDVVTTETKDVLAKASERLDFARGYYDKARDELQETVFLMGKIASSGQDLGSEKEDICFLATILMGVGNTLAEQDEQAAAVSATNPSKKQKRT